MPHPVKRTFAGVEPCAVKVASAVLWGLGVSTGPRLPDRRVEIVNGWEATVSVCQGAGHGSPRGSSANR